MFHNDQLSAALVFDHQTRLRRAATRRRLVGRKKVPPAEIPPASVRAVVWSDDADPAPSQPRAHCVA